jgi:hypothetical protein
MVFFFGISIYPARIMDNQLDLAQLSKWTDEDLIGRGALHVVYKGIDVRR